MVTTKLNSVGFWQVNRAGKPRAHLLPSSLQPPLQVNRASKPPASHLLHFHYFGVGWALKSQKDSKRHSKRSWALRQLPTAEKRSS